MEKDTQKNTGKTRRILAAAALALIGLLLIGLILSVLLHAPTGVILTFLFCLIVIPAVIYGILAFFRQNHKD